VNLAVRRLQATGCHASGLISDEADLSKAVRSETRSNGYAVVILATGRQRGSRLARGLRLDPIHRLRWRLGRRLIVVPLGPRARRPR
jgi:hypothetical protein